MPKSSSVTFSVVLAVRDVEEMVGRDVRRIAEHLRARGTSFEILAVNDGCRDNSLTVLRLLAAQVPELRLHPGDVSGRAFLRGAAEASGEVVALAEIGRGTFPLPALGWAHARLAAGRDAVVFRGRCIVAARLACLSAIVRASGRGPMFESTFERSARGLSVDVVGAPARRRRQGLLGPVLRLLAV